MGSSVQLTVAIVGLSTVVRLGTLFEASLEVNVVAAGEMAAEVRIPVRIPVNVCRRVTTPPPVALGVPLLPVRKGGREDPATPILAEFRLVADEQADAGVRAGGLGALRGVIIGGGKAGLEKVSTDLETMPFFSVRIRMMEERLQPGVSSNAK